MSAQAHWSDDDITTLIAFLILKKASAGDGIGFKGSIWTEAAMAVNKVPPTKGANKTSGSCKSKWGKVHYLLSSFVIVTDWPYSCSRALAGLNSVATNKCWASQENPLSWLNSTKHFFKLKDPHEVFSCLVQCHTGHAYMGEFWKQFFPGEDIACVCRENLQTCKCIIRFA